MATHAGQDLLAWAATLPDDKLTRLSRLGRQVPVELARETVQQLSLRKRAAAKFAEPDGMLFTRHALEQATSGAIAAYRAARYAGFGMVLDACCGLGGDSIAIATRGPVIAVDINEAEAVCCRANTRNADVRVVCADATSLDLASFRKAGVRSAFLDPSRRADTTHGRTRLRSASEWRPPIEFAADLLRHFEAVSVKMSPAVDDAVIEDLGGSVEFVSYGGECRECLLWLGDPGLWPPFKKRATIIANDGSAGYFVDTGEEHAGTGDPAAWIYEPDPAVIRAGLTGALASLHGLCFIDPSIPYLTGDIRIDTPYASAYRVITRLPWSINNLRRALREHNLRLTAVKKRAVKVVPEMVMSRAGDVMGERDAVAIIARQSNKEICILCEPKYRPVELVAAEPP